MYSLSVSYVRVCSDQKLGVSGRNAICSAMLPRECVRSKQSATSVCAFSAESMSDRDKTDSETLGGVLINGIGGRESPAVGVSGGKPLVNGDLRDGEGDGEYVSALKDSGSSATADIVAVKVRICQNTVYCQRGD